MLFESHFLGDRGAAAFEAFDLCHRAPLHLTQIRKMSRARQEKASAFIFFLRLLHVSLSGQRRCSNVYPKKMRQRTIILFLLLISKLVIFFHASLLKNRFLRRAGVTDKTQYSYRTGAIDGSD